MNVTEAELLYFRIDALQVLVQAVQITSLSTSKVPTFTLRQTIVAWLTAHIPAYLYLQAKSQKLPSSRYPTMRLSVGPHLLPDMSGAIQLLDFNNVFGSKSDMPSAFAHIMSKALPRRCQIRELSQVFDGLFYTF